MIREINRGELSSDIARRMLLPRTGCRDKRARASGQAGWLACPHPPSSFLGRGLVADLEISRGNGTTLRCCRTDTSCSLMTAAADRSERSMSFPADANRAASLTLTPPTARERTSTCVIVHRTPLFLSLSLCFSFSESAMIIVEK